MTANVLKQQITQSSEVPPKGSLYIQKAMNFRKISERGVISDPKNFVAFFFALKTPILVMIFRKNVKKVGGSFPIWKISLQIWCRCNRFVMNFQKSCIIFYEIWAGKFTHFGENGLPYIKVKIFPLKKVYKKVPLYVKVKIIQFALTL